MNAVAGPVGSCDEPDRGCRLPADRRGGRDCGGGGVRPRVGGARLAISRGVTDQYAVEAVARRYVLRLYPTHWRTRADVLFELDFIRHAAARGVPVAAPFRGATVGG